ncbi:MAG: hypothetical protein ABH846_02155 [Patescibacteria group bacterium]
MKKIRPGQPDEDTLVQNDWGYEFKRFFSYFDLEEMRRYFKNSGLEVIWDDEADSDRPGGTVWLQIIGKKNNL